MSDYVISFIRSNVHVWVGVAVAWMATAGFDVSPAAEVALGTGLVGVVSALYYGVARKLENRWPWLGYLLGVPTQPTYTKEN